MGLQQVVNSRLGVGLALALGRWLPPRSGYRLANGLADLLAARRRSPMVRAIRANQWVISGERASPAQLDEAVRLTLRHAARCVFDLYHTMDRPARLERLVAVDAGWDGLLARLTAGVEGTVVAVPHLSNFDLVARAAARRGLRAQVISYAHPGGGYRWQNSMRQEAGLEITPGSTGALRRALRRLEDGGGVITGVDWPLPASRHCPRFFNRPAALPVVHIVLALKAQVPVIVAAAVRRPDGRYGLEVSAPIVMAPGRDHQSEIRNNAETVLSVAAELISRTPTQWAMFYPVWPEVAPPT